MESERPAANVHENLYKPAVVEAASERESDAVRRERWRKPRTVVQVWTCGDDHCDCEQAEVVHIEPNLAAGYPWIKPTRIDEGPFYTDGEGWIGGRVHADAEALAAKHKLEYTHGD